MAQPRWEYCTFDHSEPSVYYLLTRKGEERIEVEACTGFLRNKHDKAACTIARLGNRGWEAFQLHDGLLWFKRMKPTQEKDDDDKQR